MADITLTDEQSLALFEIRTWFTNRMAPFWRLKGYAGTGKTAMMKFLIESEDFHTNKSIAVIAFTHVAAGVLRSKGVEQASTIHSLIYRAEEDASGNFVFIRRQKNEVKDMYSLIVVDEASMVTKAMREDILSFGVPVLFVGDAAQLPPVSNDPDDQHFMEDAESSLTEIHRQAKDSAIIRLATDIRQGKRFGYGKYGPGVWIIREDELEDDLIMATDQIIVGKNVTRKLYNKVKRRLNGFKPRNFPSFGEKIMCLENHHQLGIFNGTVIESNEDNNHLSLTDNIGLSHSCILPISSMDKSGAHTDSKGSMPLKLYFDGSMDFNTINEERHFMKSQGLIKVDYAEAISCHKSQGSSYEKPVLIEEFMKSKEFHRRWMYTGVTRASKKLILVRPN